MTEHEGEMESPVEKGPTMEAVNVQAYGAEVHQIVDVVFQTMLGLEVLPAGNVADVPDGCMTATVFLTGGWWGAVVVEVSLQFAFDLTARLMSIERPSSANEDVFDAMGEVVNMIGGNLKSLLPAGVHLSMPSVVEGQHYFLRICGAKLRKRAFACGDEIFWITLAETKDQTEAVKLSLGS